MFPMVVIVQTSLELLRTLVLLPRHHCVRLYLVHVTPGQCGTQIGSDIKYKSTLTSFTVL